MKRFLKIILFIIILSVSVVLCTNILKDKNSIQKNEDFFAEKQPYDVLFFGSSHMELFVSPIDLWRDYGITSHNFGAPEEGLSITYQAIKNACYINKPKLIVLDMHMFKASGNYSDNSKLHFCLDSFPLNKIKLQSIVEATDSKEEFLEMVFTIGKYHGRWKDMLEGNLFSKQYYVKGNMSYGYWHTMKVTPFEQYELVSDVGSIDRESDDYIYVKKIIDYCKLNNIELLLVSTPYYCNKGKQKNIHTAELIAKEEGIPYINFVDMNSIIDMKTDMYDEGHVNQSGLHKVTDYIGSYIYKNYGFENKMENDLYSSWNAYYGDYKELKSECFSAVNNLPAILEMLHDEHIGCFVYVGSNSSIENKDLIERLLQNINRQNITVDFEDDIKSSDMTPLSYLNEVYLNRDYLFENLESLNEYTDDEAFNTIKSQTPELDLDKNKVIISVYDKDTKELLVVKQFSSEEYAENLYENVTHKYLF